MQSQKAEPRYAQGPCPGFVSYGAPAGIRTRIESLGGSSPIQLDDKRVKMEAPAWFEHATSRVEAGCSVR